MTNDFIFYCNLVERLNDYASTKLDDLEKAYPLVNRPVEEVVSVLHIYNVKGSDS